MYKYFALLLIASSLYLQSCDEDFFSQVVEVELPEHQSLPAIFSEMQAGDSFLSVLVSNSKSILEADTAYQLPEDAVVNLYQNDALLTTLNFDTDTKQYTAMLPTPLSGQTSNAFRLEVSVPGFETVEAIQQMPQQPRITNAVYELEGTIDTEGYRVDEITVDIEDTTPNQVNYYGINVYQHIIELDNNGDTLYQYINQLYLDSNDPLLSYGDKYSFIFSDEGFTDGKYQLRAFSSYRAESDENIEVHLHQLTRDAFLYYRSKDQYYNALDNPFAEPVTVHTNIAGGYGIFSLSNVLVYPLE
ncbi:MAG: DUF4249 domain-containing protein [Saprospiraceae bacterium]